MRRSHVAAAAAAIVLSFGCSKGTTHQEQEPRPRTFQAADVVIGQPDFASTAPDRGASTSPAGVRFPVGDAHLAAGQLVLPDTYNHRLLVYSGVPATSGAAAQTILGQPDGAASAPGLELGRFHYPQSVASGEGGLIVADTAASRVVLRLGGDPIAIGWGEGTPAYRWGCAADRLSAPSRAIAAAGKLVVADRANHRVLVWNQVPSSGAPADLVLGQQDLTHCAANDMVGTGRSGGRNARTLQDPTDVWSDGQRLLVVDRGNNRVLLWNRFPTASGAAADVVLGQPDFLVAAAGTSGAGLSGPAAVASDGARIFVADARNHRVLGWRSFPSANGQPADVVLGQGDFTRGAANDDDQDGVAGAATARTLHHPTGVAFAGDALIVTDTYNHRFLVFAAR